MDGNGNGLCFAYDVLLDILRRLPCRALARSRRVCRAWRSVVDAHNLLFPHFFPRGAFPGIFTKNYHCDTESSFIAPSAPCSGRPRRAHGGPVFRRPLFWHAWVSVIQHCNGLLLLDDSMYRYVCNPATVRCARVPVPSEEPCRYDEGMFLAFDPAVSRHHEVFILPRGKTLPDIEEEQLSEEDQEDIDTMEHFGYVGEFDTSSPSRLDVLAEEASVPSQQGKVLPVVEQLQEIHVYVSGSGAEELKDKLISILVFSSQTGQWASREYRPGRCAPGHLYDLVTAPHPSFVKMWKTAEYWQGSLYVYCWNNIIMILRNSEGSYDMALLPGKAYGDRSDLSKRSILVSYERGVHYVAVSKLQLHVWTLTESVDGQVGWMLAHKGNLISPYDDKVHQWREPGAPWEVVKNNKTLVSLFEPCKNEEITYARKDGQKDRSDDVDCEVDDEDEGIHEVDGFGGTTNGIDKDGHGEERDTYEDEYGEFKSGDSFKYSWDSGEDNFMDLDESAEFRHYKVIGLHPHKDVILLQNSDIFATYHFRTSRMQYLGGWHHHRHDCGIEAVFPYRTCYVDALPATKLPS